MNKRILILCEAIAPPAYSPRIITLVEWLQANGWNCEIATERDNDTVWNSTACKTHQMPTYRHLVADKLLGAKEKAFAKYTQQHTDVASFDLIFCGSYYYFPLQAAKYLAKKYQLPLVVDLRDITEQWGKLDYYTRRFTGIRYIDSIAKGLYTYINTLNRNRVLRNATAVTTVSPWHQHTLALYNPNTHLIYNGYDANTFYPKTVISNAFDITFIGKYYSHYQDCPKLLFMALQSLIDTNQITIDDVEVHFYTNTVGQKAFATLAKEYALDNIVKVHDYIPRSEIVDRMHRSSIMLVLTTPIGQYGTHGMMGTKFYEILGVEKPCLCLNSDEECLADAIENTHAGLAATKVEDVKAFILDKYQEWKENGYTHQAVIDKEQYTRQHEAKQFEQLFLQCIK